MNKHLLNISNQNFGFLFVSSFIILNFVDRSLSNVAMIALLVLSLFHMYRNRDNLSINMNEKSLIYSFLSFTVILMAFAFYHSSKIDELDNYSRFVLLLPIYFYLRTLWFSPKAIIYILISSSIISLSSIMIDFEQTYSAGNSIIPGRHNPVSSSALTYGNLNMTIFVLLIGSWIFRNKLKINSLLLMIGLFASFLSWGLTHSKGALIGLAFVFIYLNIANKSIRLFSFIVILIGTLIISSTELNQRFKIFINDTMLVMNGQDIMTDNIDLSIRERYFYYKNAVEIIKNNPLEGIGFDRFEDYLNQKKIKQNLDIRTSDHAHNEFLDIALKSGLIGLLVFLILFANIFRFFAKVNLDNIDSRFFKYSGNIVLLSQIGFMLTQSQLAHHQSTVFFIILVLLFASQITNRTNNTN